MTTHFHTLTREKRTHYARTYSVGNRVVMWSREQIRSVENQPR